MISINLPKKASLDDIVNRINSLKESSVGIDANGEMEEVTNSESYDMVLPYKFYEGSAVVYNNEIHILGGYDSSYKTAHYKWNGSSWTNIIIITKLKYLFKYFLPKNTKIYCDKTALSQDTETSESSSGVALTENTNGYIVSVTGNVRLLSINSPTEVQLAHSIVYE